MKNKLYTVLAQFEAKSGKEQELEEILTSLIAPTLKEEGCVNYDFHKCSDNPVQFMFYENWLNHETFKKHINSPHIKQSQTKIDELLAKPYEVTFWEIFK